MSTFNFPIKNNLSVRFSREQKVFQQLTHKDALMDALISLYNNTAKCQHKDPQESANAFVQLYKPICHEFNKTKISLKDFKVLNKDTYVEGAFGKVTIVKSIHDKENIYAMKTLNKSHLIKQAGRSSPMEERLILSNENEEWLPKLYASFQDPENLYLVMEYAHGGDLENLMSIRDYKFNEDEARFYCAELILAIERVHELGYMHRDIKPANILIDSKGHIKLGDLGCCISIDTTESLFPVGTALYMSPEMSDSTFGTTIYGPEADWWSVGIILYELLYGVTPFTGKVSDIQKSLMNPKVQFDDKIEVSKEAKDLITKLLLKTKSDRLGVKGGVSGIKSHPFFKDINWTTLRKEAIPPFIPSIKSLDDTTFFAATNSQDEEDEDVFEFEDDEEEDDEEDMYRDYQFIGYSYTCSQLSKDTPSTANKESRKLDDNKAFLAQFRQKLTQPANNLEEEKLKLQQKYESEIAELKALLNEKSNTLDNIHHQMEEEKSSMNNLHSEEICRMTTLLQEKDARITELQSKVNTLETNNNDENIQRSEDIKNLNTLLEEKNEEIAVLASKNKALEVNNKKVESNLDTLLLAQSELESNVKLLAQEKKELETDLGQVKKQLEEQNDAADSTLNQELTNLRNKVETLESQLKEKVEKEIPSLESENEKLYAENRELNEQLHELENQVAAFDSKLSNEAIKSKELVSQYESKLKAQSTDYDMVIKQTKAECLELKNELLTLQNQTSTATRMKRSTKSLPSIPSNASPQLTPSAEYSPGEGRSLILSSMWQRDRDSLRNVQQALEESERKLAFAKKQVIRLKREVKCFQNYTFEQERNSEAPIKGDHYNENSFHIPHNVMDYSDKKSPTHRSIPTGKTTAKKTPLPITPPHNAVDYFSSVSSMGSIITEKNLDMLNNNTPLLKEAKIRPVYVNRDSYSKKDSAPSAISDSDALIMKEIRKEQNFINSTKRTIAARARLSRSRCEIDQELERSLELSNKKMIALQSKLEKPISI